MWFIHSGILVEPPICWALYDVIVPVLMGSQASGGDRCSLDSPAGVNELHHRCFGGMLGSWKGPRVVRGLRLQLSDQEVPPSAGPLYFPLQNDQGWIHWVLSSFQLITSLNYDLTETLWMSQEAKHHSFVWTDYWVITLNVPFIVSVNGVQA